MSDASVWARESALPLASILSCLSFHSSIVTYTASRDFDPALCPQSSNTLTSKLNPKRVATGSSATGSSVTTVLTADPTLHRLSTPEDLAAIKRRAAPKLFRTRRLANGQIVRTRAGPAVEAKAREIRENIAESRRHRGSIGSLYSAATYDDRSPEPVTPAFAHAGMPIAGLPIMNDNMAMSLSYTDKARLGNITEGQPSQHFSPPFEMERDRRESLITMDGMGCAKGYHELPPASAYPYGQVQIYQPPHAPQTPCPFPCGPTAAQEHLAALTSQEARAFQSCPASIHTSPVPARLGISHAGWAFMGNETNQDIKPAHFEPHEQVKNLHINTAVTTRIAAPAATPPFPFHLPSHLAASHNYPVSPSTGSPSNAMPWSSTPVPGTPHLMPNSADTIMQTQASWGHSSSSFTPSHAPPSLEVQPPLPAPPVSPHGGLGTIDPRWVSPISSVWNTPVQTPRSGSPSQQDANMAEPGPDASPSAPISLEHTPVPASRVYGTQSYPPRLAERRQMQPPHLWENTTGTVVQQDASPQQQLHQQLISPASSHEPMGPPSVPQYADMSSAEGGQWFQ